MGCAKCRAKLENALFSRPCTSYFGFVPTMKLVKVGYQRDKEQQGPVVIIYVKYQEVMQHKGIVHHIRLTHS